MGLKNLLFPVSNWLKVGLACAADLINAVFDPFEEFTRPVCPKYPEALEVKAEKFEAHMTERFFDGAHSLWLHTRTPGDYHTLRDVGDQALWQGVYTAMWAIKHSVTGDPIDGARCDAGLTGMMWHQWKDRLIRGIYWENDELKTMEDASNDSATGHLMGAYFAWRYGMAASRGTAVDLLDGLAMELLTHDCSLVNPDGKPTTYGRLVQGHLTDPLRLLLCLAVFKAAHRATGYYPYVKKYSELSRRFFAILPYGNLRILWKGQSSQPMRAAIIYSILCDLEQDHDLHRQYLRGLMRTWKMERKSANPTVYYLMRRQMLLDPADLALAKKHLHEMTLEDKQFNVERINSNSVPTFKWGKYRRARQPLPRWKLGSQDYFDSRTAYAVDDWVGNKVGDTEHNGADFLLPYWGFRQLRLI